MMTTETTETKVKAKQLWDAVVDAAYNPHPEEGAYCEWEECQEGCECEDGPMISSYHYFRHDNTEQLVELFRAAYEYCRNIPFGELPELDEDEGCEDFHGYVTAAYDMQCSERADDDFIDPIVDWTEEWLTYASGIRNR
jgi:hypothetical protein